MKKITDINPSGMSREDWATLLRHGGNEVSEERIDKAWEGWKKSTAISKVLEENGLKVASRNHLVRLSNVTMRGGRLHDGTEHRRWEVIVTGSTFGIKDDLKSLGFKWDPNAKGWWRAMRVKGASIADHMETARTEVAELFDDSGECEYCGKAWDYDHECPGTLSEARECEKIERDYR